MSLSLRFGLGTAFLAVVATAYWVSSTLDERQKSFEAALLAYSKTTTVAPAWGCSGNPEPAYLEVTHTTVPPTREAALTWAALLQRVDMPFEEETALEDVLKYVQSCSVSPALPHGIALYVAPEGLFEADKTIYSPVVIDLQHVSLASALTLLLQQLDLKFRVLDDGIVKITYIASKDAPSPEDEIRTQLSNLRIELERMRAAAGGVSVYSAR